MSPVMRPMLEAPWGPTIGVYFILVGLATGITLLTRWVHPPDEHTRARYEWAATWMAFIALVGASALLIIDLGQPWRFHLMVTSFSNLGSPMSVGAKLIALKLYLLVIYLYLLARRRGALAAGDVTLTGRATRTLFAIIPAALGIVSLTLAVYPAILLARTWSSPLARTAGASVIFLSTALLMGTAAVMIMVWIRKWPGETALRGRLHHLLLFLVLAQVPLVGLWLLSVDTNQAPLALAWSRLLQGAGGAIFWSVVIGLGLVAPALGLAGFPRQPSIAIGCAFAVLIGASTTRYLFFSLL